LRTGYYNGERVYVYGPQNHLNRYSCENSDKMVQIFKHKDLIRMLNNLFKRIERAPAESLQNGLLDPLAFYSIISNFSKDGLSCEKIPFEMCDNSSFCFDDATKTKPARMARLQNAKKIKQDMGSLKLVNGGLYKPSDRPNYLADDMISDEFKKWQREQKNNTPEVTT